MTSAIACATADGGFPPGPDAAVGDGKDVAPGADAAQPPPLLIPDAAPDQEPALEVAYVSGYRIDGFFGARDIGSLVLVRLPGDEPFTGDVRVLEVSADPRLFFEFTIEAGDGITVEPGTASGELNSGAQQLILGSGLVAEDHTQSGTRSILDVLGQPGDYDAQASVTLAVGDRTAVLPFVFEVRSATINPTQRSAARVVAE